MKVLKPPQSGSHDGLTASRNSFGQYERVRAIPVNVASPAQLLVRARMSANSSAWRALTPDQRAGWAGLGAAIVRSDSLGQSYSLQGNQAYASVNNNRGITGLVAVADAPAIATPLALATCTVTTTGGTLSVAYTVTPLAAATYLLIFAGPQRSAGRNFEGDFRFIALTAAAAASPHNLLAAYSAKFGVPVIGNKIFFSLVTVTLGFESGPLIVSKVVTA